MPASWRLGLSMVVALAIGFAYVVWLAWAEGWRLWVVLGVMTVVGVIGGAVHLAMGMARQRDGLETSDSASDRRGSEKSDGAPPGGEAD